MNRAATASGNPVSGPLPIPTLYPCPTTIILNRGSMPKRSLSMGLGTQLYFVHLCPSFSNCPCIPPPCRASSPTVGGRGWDEEVSQQRESRGGAGWSRGPVLRSLLPHLAWPLSLSLNHWCLKKRMMKKRSWNLSWSWKHWGGTLLPAVLMTSPFSHSLQNKVEI